MQQTVADEQAMKDWARVIGAALKGGELLELVGDVGAGKTTFTKGLARGMAIEEVVQSPSFTISRQYDNGRGLRLAHYDFYRLDEAGIMADELREVSDDPATVTVIEWADAVSQVLPGDRLQLTFRALDEQTREVTVQALGERSQAVLERLA